MLPRRGVNRIAQGVISEETDSKTGKSKMMPGRKLPKYFWILERDMGFEPTTFSLGSCVISSINPCIFVASVRERVPDHALKYPENP